MTGKDAQTRSWRDTFLVYFQWPIIQVFLLGIASGFPLLLTASTLSARLTEAGIDIKLIGIFALVGLPYTFKFLVSPIIDAVRLPGVKSHLMHRKSWCALTQCMLALSIMGMALIDPAEDIFLLGVFALLTATFSAMQDIVIDALRIELLPKDSQGAGAAASVIGYRIGMLIAGAGAFVMASFLPWNVVYHIGALIMAAFLAVTFCINRLHAAPEKSHDISNAGECGDGGDDDKTSNLSQTADDDHPPAEEKTTSYKSWFYTAIIAPFADFLRRDGAILILFFIALFKLGDAMAGSLSTTFYLNMGFTKIEIAAVTKVIGVIAVLAGSFIGGFVVKRTTIIRALVICGTLQILSNFVFVWLANVGASVSALTVCICVENVTGGMGTAAFVAYMSQLCNVRFTATQYALLSSLSSVGRTLFSSSAGFLVDNLGWSGFYVSTAAFGVPGMILLYFVWKTTSSRESLSAE